MLILNLYYWGCVVMLGFVVAISLSFVLFCVWDRIPLCNYGTSPGTTSVDQAVLKFTDTETHLPPKCWD